MGFRRSKVLLVNAGAKFENVHPGIVEKILFSECMENASTVLCYPTDTGPRNIMKRRKNAFIYTNLDIKRGSSLKESYKTSNCQSMNYKLNSHLNRDTSI